MSEELQHFSPAMVNNPVAATACGAVAASHLVTYDYPDEVDCPACLQTPAYKERLSALLQFTSSGGVKSAL